MSELSTTVVYCPVCTVAEPSYRFADKRKRTAVRTAHLRCPYCDSLVCCACGDGHTFRCRNEGRSVELCAP